MARKKKHPEHVNHERWLVSWADFMTLLFAFFVVMFAVSQVDSNKVGRFTESFSKAVGVDMFPQPGRGLLAGSTEGAMSDEVTPSKGSPMPEELASLRVSLSESGGAGTASEGLQVIAHRTELVLRLSDNLLFESGNDALQERARPVVAYLAKQLRDRRVNVRVEGHTDDRPIHTVRYRSNWDLSTARATTIVGRLASEGIAPPRLSAAGYGEFHPIAPNTTDEGRKLNRRVDLVVTLFVPVELPLDEDAGTKEEATKAPTQEPAKPEEPAKHDAAAPEPSKEHP